MPTDEQWRQLRELDRIATKVRGTYRERYIRDQIGKLQEKMRLSRAALGTDRDAGANEHLPDGLTANAELFPDL